MSPKIKQSESEIMIYSTVEDLSQGAARIFQNGGHSLSN